MMATETKAGALDVAAIRARADAATPGPWSAAHRCSGCTVADDETCGLGLEVDGPPEPQLRGQFARGADAEFIVHARTDAPALCDEVERLRAALVTFVDHVDEYLHDASIAGTSGWHRYQLQRRERALLRARSAAYAVAHEHEIEAALAPDATTNEGA